MTKAPEAGLSLHYQSYVHNTNCNHVDLLGFLHIDLFIMAEVRKAVYRLKCSSFWRISFPGDARLIETIDHPILRIGTRHLRTR